SKLKVPDLQDPARIAHGAGNYDAMSTGCHLKPGAEPTELSKGLYPAPPNLSQQTVAAAEAFWAIKHGVKASGMPAWGKSMDDAYIWNMVAFLQQLPKLDAVQYQALVARSGGHSHGGGESGGHSHAEGAGDAHEEMEHEHAEGTAPHADAAKASAEPEAHDEHQHEH
ncbi:MAG TPA: cytochrome c, partial [Lysobacter sp.]